MSDLSQTHDNNANRDTPMEVVMADYIRACESGNPPDRQQFLHSHPDLASELKQFFAQRDQMARLVEPIRDFVQQIFRTVGAEKQIRYVGNFELLEEVARGATGVVYKARHKLLGRIVALKMMRAGRLAKAEDLKRFQIEAHCLRHPNIVPIHEVGQYLGLHYLSMGFVEGRNLSAILRENPLSAKQAAIYVRQMAEAIHCAHQQGTCHGDLKTSNILIDNRDQVRITGFGLAMRIEGDSDLTQTGQILGTTSDMAPELSSDILSLNGPGRDVYSLGAILYECLTGRALFRVDEATKTIERGIHVKAPSPQLLNRRISRDLETICLKCLEKETHRRYATAQLLADDLGRFLRGEPTIARLISIPAQVWGWTRRSLAVGAVSLAVFAVSMAVIARSYNDQLQAVNHELRAVPTSLKMSSELLAIEAVLNNRLNIEDDDLRPIYHGGNFRLHGHKGAVKSVKFSPDNRLIASAGDDTTIRLWDAIRGKVVRIIDGHAAQVTSVCFNSDGKRLVSASTDGKVKVWNTESGHELLSLEGHEAGVTCVAFSSDDRHVASGSEDKTVRVWDTSIGQTVHIKHFANTVSGVDFAPDGKRIACVARSDDDTLANSTVLWEPFTGNEIPIKNKRNSQSAVALSPDGISLAIADESVKKNQFQKPRVVLWNFLGEPKFQIFAEHETTITSLAFSPDGKWLASASLDHTVKVWDVAARLEDHVFHEQAGVYSAAFSSDSVRLTAGTADGVVIIWSLPGVDARTAFGSTERKWGTLRGQVIFPADVHILPPLVRQGAVIGIGSVVPKDVPDESLLVDPKSKGIANVVIYLPTRPALVHPNLEQNANDPNSEKSPDDSTIPEVKITIKDFRFESHVTVVRVGSKIRFINHDPVSYAVSWTPRQNDEETALVATGVNARRRVAEFAAATNVSSVMVAPGENVGRAIIPFSMPEKIPVKVVDHVYNWPTAYWVVLDHPYVAVTDKDGKFEIRDLPFGDHSFKVWQESHGYLNRNFNVKIDKAFNEQNPLLFEPQ